jgi:hypothetical protein
MSAAGYCKQVDIRRLPGRAPSKMVNSVAAKRIQKSHHRGWSTHIATSRNKPAKPNQAPNGIFITSGEIGTNAMHPPGKRSININIKIKVKKTVSIRAGGHGGPPLRGGFVSIRGIIKTGPNTNPWFRNDRRHQHAPETYTKRLDIHCCKYTFSQSTIRLSIQTILEPISRFTFPTVLGTLS